MRNWDIEAIKNSNMSDEMKKIIIQEYNHDVLSDIDPNNFTQRNISIKDLKRNYKQADRYLYSALQDYYLVTLGLHALFNYDDIARYEFEKTNLTDEDLIQYTLEFYASLGDKEIYDKMAYLMDEKNHLLKIEPYDSTNPICLEVKGRCIKSFTSNDVLMSYYMRNTSEDLSIFAHETGHMLTHSLFGEKVNKFIRNFLSETESYLFESLMNSYIANELKLPDLALHIEANRTAKIIDIIWSIRVLEHLKKQLGSTPNIKRLNYLLAKDGFKTTYTNADYKLLTTLTLYELNSILYSYLITLHFYNEISSDKEKGLYLYKKFMTSPQSNPTELLRNYNIQEDELINNLEIMYEKAVALKKRNNKL